MVVSLLLKPRALGWVFPIKSLWRGYLTAAYSRSIGRGFFFNVYLPIVYQAPCGSLCYGGFLRLEVLLDIWLRGDLFLLVVIQRKGDLVV